MAVRKIDATLALKSGGRLLVGRDRIAILEAVAKHGSITNAAKALGYSYKAAWDGVIAINNLLPRPAIVTQSGGQKGGGATVTEEGQRLIIAFRKLEEKLARISASIAKEGLDQNPDLLFWSVAMRTSARNVLRCTVTEILRAPVNVEVELKLSGTHTIIAVITNESARELDLAPGGEVIALVKSSFVMLASGGGGLKLSTPNRMTGTVASRVDGGVNSEIALDLGEGKTLVSVVTKAAADEMGLAAGDTACAFFNPSHVILAAG